MSSNWFVFNTYVAEGNALMHENLLQKQGYQTKIVKKRLRNHTCFSLQASVKMQIQMGRPKKIQHAVPTDFELRELLQEE